MNRIQQLEEEAEFDGALISKLQTDAAQVIGKDKLIIELESQLEGLKKEHKNLFNNSARMRIALQKIRDSYWGGEQIDCCGEAIKALKIRYEDDEDE